MNNDEAQLMDKQTSTQEEDNYLCVTLCIWIHLQQQHYNNSVRSVDKTTFLQTHLVWDLQIQGEWGMIFINLVGLSN